jgi:acetolactate synthase-1/2/3 large subunit
MRDLAESKRPGILVGGGAYKARQPIGIFADYYGIPVFRTWSALDVVTDDAYCYGGTVGTYGGPGRNLGIQNTDLLLILGCRLSGRITGGTPKTFARAAKKYWVDVDHDLLENHEIRADVRIVDDAGNFLASRVSDFHSHAYSLWLGKVKAWRKTYDPVKPEHFTDWHHYGFMRRLSHQLPSNAIVTYDTGGNAIMMGQCFESKNGQRIFSSNGNTPMGFSLCGAIGAWFAEPERPVICIIGDGGMSLNIQELQTIVHYGVNLKVFILNNHILGNTKGYQRVNKKPEIACGPDGYSAPNFSAIAKAYGIESMSLDGWDRFDYVVGNSLASDKAVIVDVVHHDFCTYEPRISRFDLPIEDMYPYLPRDKFREEMMIEPLAGWESVQ